MSTEDLNNAQAVTEPDLTADVVVQPDLTDQPVQDQNQEVLADGTTKDKNVPYSELEKATKAKNEEAEARRIAEEKAAYAQRQLELYQMNAQQTQQVQAPQSTMEQALVEMGLTADDLYGETILKVQNRSKELDNQQMQQNQQQFANQQFMATHSDVNEVIGSVNPMTKQFMPSAELYGILAKKPHLTGACSTLEGAYQTVMEQRELVELRKSNNITKEHQVRTGVQVATQPLGGSAAGGGGSGSQQGQALLSREQTLQIERDIQAGKY